MPKRVRKNSTLARLIEEFRACVLGAYEPIMRDFGFAELPPRQDEFVNEFTVRIGNATTVIEVEGTNYGASAWTKVFRASEADASYYGLPIGALLTQRQGLTAKDIKKLRRKPSSQAGDIKNAAADIYEHARDVLMGDFSKLGELAEEERLFLEKQAARALPKERKAAAVAASEAGHAFKRGDYGQVVDLLEPHLSYLPRPQRKRLEIAKAALADRQH